MERDEVRFEERNAEDCDVLLVAYGLSSRACLEALSKAHEKGLKLGLLRPITLWPFPSKRLNELAGKVKAVLTVEQSLGQLVQDVRLAVNGKAPVYLNAYPSGDIPSGDSILTAAASALKGEGEGLFDLQKYSEGFEWKGGRNK